MLKVWGRRSSANVQKVMWLVGELGIEHEHIPAGGPYGGLDTPEFRAMNPNGLVPVIDDNGTILWESGACVRYLAARYGGGTPFWPDDLAARARADQWMDWAVSTFQPDVLGLFWSYWRTPQAQRNPRQIQVLGRRAAQRILFLDKIFANQPYLAGDDISLADIPTGVHLYRYFTMGTTYPDAPNVQAWYGRLKDRPAYAEHVMISYEELRGKLTF